MRKLFALLVLFPALVWGIIAGGSSFIAPAISTAVTVTYAYPLSLSSSLPAANTTAYAALNVPGMAAGTAFSDPVTGTRTVKVTDTVTPTAVATATRGYIVLYASQGLQIAGPWGTGLNKYTIIFEDFHNNQWWLCDYTLGGTTSNYRTVTIQGAAGSFAFDRANPGFLWYVDASSNLHYYNTFTNANADYGPFPASWPGVLNGWVMVNTTNTYATAINTNGSIVTSMNLVTGAVTTRTFANMNELYLIYGNTAFVNNDNGAGGLPASLVMWNVAANTTLNSQLPYSANFQKYNHTAPLNGYIASLDTNASPMQIWRTNTDATYSNPSATSWYYGQWHLSGHWMQPAVADQFMLISTWYDNPGSWTAAAQYQLAFIRVSDAATFTLGHAYTSQIANAFDPASAPGASVTADSTYWNLPFASSSNDGKLVLFESNMMTNNTTGHQDIFLMEVPTSASQPW
jgi:hypothetical protein